MVRPSRPMWTSLIRRYLQHWDKFAEISTFATYKVNICNIKKHVLEHQGAGGKNSRRNIEALFHATSVQKFLQYQNKVTATSWNVATSHNHNCNICRGTCWIELNRLRGASQNLATSSFDVACNMRPIFQCPSDIRALVYIFCIID